MHNVFQNTIYFCWGVFKSEKVLVSVHSWKLESVPLGSRLHYFSKMDRYSDCLLYITARQNILAWQIIVYQNMLQYTCIKLTAGWRLPIQNIKLAVGCRLPIQIRNGQYKFNESETGNYCSCQLPIRWTYIDCFESGSATGN